MQSASKHFYPVIPDAADDEVSHKRNSNMLKLKEECLKPRPTQDIVKALLICTYPVRRAEVLDSDSSIVEDLPVLKRCFYVYIPLCVGGSIVGIGKKLYGFGKISRFKNQPCNRLYPKKPAGMHW